VNRVFFLLFFLLFTSLSLFAQAPPPPPPPPPGTSVPIDNEVVFLLVAAGLFGALKLRKVKSDLES